MINTDEFIAEYLLGRLWHVTSQERFHIIKTEGFIKPEPNIPNEDRWSTSGGERWYPFVRYLGGFSLFDFPSQFDVADYRHRCPSSSLEAFIPYPESWGHALWIEIDQIKQHQNIIRGCDLWKRCEVEGQGRRCMPYVEAAHIGEMPITSIRSVYSSDHLAEWQCLHNSDFASENLNKP